MSDDLHVNVKLDEQQLRNLLPRCDRCQWWTRATYAPPLPGDDYARLRGEPTNLGFCKRLRVVGLTLAPSCGQPVVDMQPSPTTLEDFGCVLYEAEEPVNG